MEYAKRHATVIVFIAIVSLCFHATALEKPPSTLQPLSSSSMSSPPSPSLSPPPSLQPSSNEHLTLNFQDVEIRAVLQIIAEFAGFNLIINDTVKGNLTLHLNNVPWQHALDIVLKSKHLDKRVLGNTVIIGPMEEMIAREKQALESIKHVEDLGTLRSDLIHIKYARAEDLGNLLKDKDNRLMTSRGNVSVDKRTNALLIQDTEHKLHEIQTLLRRLDVPVKQVEISTQIITADSSIEDALGLRFAMHDHNAAMAPNAHPSPGQSTGPSPNSHFSHGLFSDLGASITGGGVARLGLALARLPNNTLVELELQALEFESKIKTIARPKLTTVDQNKAFVETGVEIPYQEMTSGGSASVAFKKAVLRLEVTPQITPDNHIVLDLSISNDSQGSIHTQNTGTGATSNVVGINTNKLQTKVLANNGETIVLGGVLTLVDTQTKTKVPILSELPCIGALFQNKYKKENQKELLIFITPRILKDLETKG